MKKNKSLGSEISLLTVVKYGSVVVLLVFLFFGVKLQVYLNKMKIAEPVEIVKQSSNLETTVREDENIFRIVNDQAVLLISELDDYQSSQEKMFSKLEVEVSILERAVKMNDLISLSLESLADVSESIKVSLLNIANDIGYLAPAEYSTDEDMLELLELQDQLSVVQKNNSIVIVLTIELRTISVDIQNSNNMSELDALEKVANAKMEEVDEFLINSEIELM